jgi:hypothetical protein
VPLLPLIQLPACGDLCRVELRQRLVVPSPRVRPLEPLLVMPFAIRSLVLLGSGPLGLVRFLRNETGAGMDPEGERVRYRWYGSVCQVTRK